MSSAAEREQLEIIRSYGVQARKAWARLGPIHKQQELQRRDRPATGPIWVSRFKIPAPAEPDLRDHVLQSFGEAGNGAEKLLDAAYASALDAEWVGFRAGISDPKEPEPQLSEQEKYIQLTKETSASPVILFVQGGGFVLGSKVTARPTVKRLCVETRARVLTLNYRLAPQYPVPAQVLDLAVAYFSLLQPHKSLPHSSSLSQQSIVLAGESAGAAFCLSLVQVLLHLRRKGITHVRFNGAEVPVQLPAGLSLVSPAADFSQSLPSVRNSPNDWLFEGDPIWSQPSWPNEPFWPADPPRGPIAFDQSAMAHPFICATAAKDWRGAPPTWIAYGGAEQIRDAIKVLIKAMNKDGVSCEVEAYEGCTHTFPVALPKLPQSDRCLKAWSCACLDFAKSDKVEPEVALIKLGTLEKQPLGHVRDMNAMGQEEAIATIKATSRAKMSLVYRGQANPGQQKSSL